MKTIKNLIKKSSDKDEFYLGLLAYSASPLESGYSPAELPFGNLLVDLTNFGSNEIY